MFWIPLDEMLDFEDHWVPANWKFVFYEFCFYFFIFIIIIFIIIVLESWIIMTDIRDVECWLYKNHKIMSNANILKCPCFNLFVSLHFEEQDLINVITEYLMPSPDLKIHKIKVKIPTCKSGWYLLGISWLTDVFISNHYAFINFAWLPTCRQKLWNFDKWFLNLCARILKALVHLHPINSFQIWKKNVNYKEL